MSDHRINPLLQEEYRALKLEMLLRIAIQNITILGSIVLFIPTVLLIVIHPYHSGTLALVYAIANLALSMQWCHQGIRQCAIKQAILNHDHRAGHKDSWEVWLPTQRPTNILGSRWFISTKLVFIGLCTVSILLALKDLGLTLVLSVAILAATTIALLTNPKE